jgi:hypothetical protein
MLCNAGGVTPSPIPRATLAASISGLNALYANTAGSNNTALGFSALRNTTGGSNIALGVNAGLNLTSGSNNIAIGNTGVGGEASTLRLGSSQTRAFIAGIKGVPISGATVTINNTGQLGIVASSARYKRDIQAMGAESQGLLQLRPVTFSYKDDPDGQRQYGLIAEEVATGYPELVTRGAKGEVESVQYHELIPMLLNEVQHQQQELVELKAQNARLQAALVQQQATLAARLEQLEAAARAATVANR